MAYLVRHAHAGDKHQWVGPDHDRPLSVAGQGEAHGLLTRLGGYRISRILSGPAIRCQQTVVPLAARFGLPVELTDDLAVKAAADQLLGLVTDPALETAVLCSHGEVIGQVLQQLVAGGLVLADPLRWEKGSTWVLDSRGGVVVGPGIWRRFDLRSWRRSLRKPCLADPPVPRTRPRAGRLVSWIWRRLPDVPERNQKGAPAPSAGHAGYLQPSQSLHHRGMAAARAYRLIGPPARRSLGHRIDHAAQILARRRRGA